MEQGWKTAVSKSSEQETLIRGYSIEELVGKKSFAETVYLILKGELPSKAEAVLIDAMLVSCVDHGINVPSVTAARIVLSAGNSFNTAVGAGILAIGEFHGGAIEQSAKFLSENREKSAADAVKQMRAEKKRIPGFGHKIYTSDPRTKRMLEIARENKFWGKTIDFALQVEKELEKQSGKKLCLNVDGCIAALITEMGFDYRAGKAFFIIARSAGICAHVLEEWQREKPFRRLDESETVYDGKAKRELK
ncbi:citryl-CoA lyase [Candidatus Micrarchaeota archaeon]|nr:citryl-CoA lyase [Candidatus Micrarchaeota archaeon]